MPSRTELDAMLDALHRSLPAPGSVADGVFDYERLQEEIAAIVAQAGEADAAHLQAHAECILGSAGLIPSDNEGEPCP